MIEIIIAVAASQFLLVALFSAFSRKPFPKFGMRRSEKILLASTLLFGASWLTLVDYRGLWKPKQDVATAAVVAPAQTRGSCARIELGMTRAEVTARLGEPDATHADEETRGPGAAVLVYKQSRCAVHIFDNKVEFID